MRPLVRCMVQRVCGLLPGEIDADALLRLGCMIDDTDDDQEGRHAFHELITSILFSCVIDVQLAKNELSSVKDTIWISPKCIDKGLTQQGFIRGGKLAEEIADICLEFSILAKKIGDITSNVLAHALRMTLCPRFKVLDAVRLLGLTPNSSILAAKVESFGVEECVPRSGIFETTHIDSDHSILKNQILPSTSACQIGRSVRSMLLSHGFTFLGCRDYLLPFVGGRLEQLFSADFFFENRFEIFEGGCDPVSGLDFLVRTFLFGLAVSREAMEEAIGIEEVDFLVKASLLSVCPISCHLVVGSVMIFPISPSHIGGMSSSHTCFFATDWSMQSLRKEKTAIMPVGYDSLELMSVTSAGLKGERLLDLCCGCGIQGIFASKCGSFQELICADINERACVFAAANSALNDVPAISVQTDLFECFGSSEFDFTWILCNPPFVAVPVEALHGITSLYASGGDDGSHTLKRFLSDFPSYLEEHGSLLLVTELPNIQDSCSFLQGLIGRNAADGIHVVYAASDVETIAEYAAEREKEYCYPPEVLNRWLQQQTKKGIRNRALAVVAAHKGKKRSSLNCYDEAEVVPPFEDILLSEDGIKYLRSALLLDADDGNLAIGEWQRGRQQKDSGTA